MCFAWARRSDTPLESKPAEQDWWQKLKKAASADAAFGFPGQAQALRLLHANISLVDCRIQMLDSFHSMTVEIVSRIVQVMPGGMHCFQSRCDLRMRWHRW